MRYMLIPAFTFLSLAAYSQNKPTPEYEGWVFKNENKPKKSDSIAYRKNFFVVGAGYLYNMYQGQRKFAGYFDSYPTRIYESGEIKNTSGFNFSAAYRHYFTRKISLQNGLEFSYKTEQTTHNDSVKNANGSFLRLDRERKCELNYSFCFNYHIRSFTISSGMLFHIIGYNYPFYTYADETVERGSHSRYGFGQGFYFSEGLQYKLVSKPDIHFNTRIDFPPAVFTKGTRGYYMILNAGVICMIERKHTPVHLKSKKEDDYVE